MAKNPLLLEKYGHAHGWAGAAGGCFVIAFGLLIAGGFAQGECGKALAWAGVIAGNVAFVALLRGGWIVYFG